MQRVDTQTQTQEFQMRQEPRPAVREERTIVDLLKELRDESLTLMRQEIALAKTELAEKTSRVGRNVAYLAVGGLILYAGLLFLLGAAMYAIFVGLLKADLSANIASWLAPLIVGAIVGGIGYAFVHKAISTLRHESALPRKTVESLQEDKEWLANKIR